MSSDPRSRVQGSGSGPRTQSVRTPASPPPVDATSVPPVLAAYFAARKIRVSLASYTPREVARYALHQRVLLRLEDLPEQDREKVQKLLQQGGFRVVDGHYLRGDTALYLQPMEQYEALGWEAYRNWADQQPNPEREAAALYDAVDGTVRHGVRVQPMSSPPDDSPLRPVHGT